MEKTVTIRFYDVRRSAEDRPAFADLVERIAALPLAQRERRITGDQILVRLEECEREGDELHGQFVRGQSGNRPGRMLPDRTDRLPFREPLGHGIAFRYRTRDGLLAVEYNPIILSPSRIMSYLFEHDIRSEYLLRPRLRDDAWRRFEELPVRKLELAIAGHPFVGNLNDPHAAVWENIAQMKEQYGADTLRIQFSMGHRQGALREGVKAFAREAFQRHEAGIDDIRAIRGVIETGAGVPNEELDLMGELFDIKEDLNFPEDDFARFYALRRDLLRNRIGLV